MMIKNFKTFVILIAISLLASACMEAPSSKKISTKSSNQTGKNGATTGPSGLPIDSSLGEGTTSNLSSRVELTHFVDPIDGNYKKKITIPRNYKGFLYIAGLNVTALQGKILKVKFYIGRDRQPVLLNATVARAPGITPKTDIEVLVVDLSSRPFLKTTLPYDLYDYTTYESGTTENFVSDNRSPGLYCRGLRNEDDPTFIPTEANPTCNGSTSNCKYSYAKVVDSTFYDVANNGFSYKPSYPSAYTGTGYQYAVSQLRNTCIPDTNDLLQVKELFNLANLNSVGVAFDAYEDYLNVSSTRSSFIYKGPFRLINKSGWDISSDAITASGNGIFETCTGDYCTGSYLFPRQGKLNSTSSFKHIFGSLTRFGSRDLIDPSGQSISPGSIFVDGCNIRSLNYNSTTGLGIGSCNLTADVELLYVKDDKEYIITQEKSIKLQLVRDSLINSEGKEVLSESFTTCSSSSMCGSSECCFNKRCWSKDLVTQCLDELPGTGNLEIGSSCRSDFECGSLCCDQSRGTCSPHNTTGSAPVLCSKSPGQACVTREYCRKETINTCKVYKIKITETGIPSCEIRCLPVETYSDCKNGVCIPPSPAADPGDPNDPDICASAPVYK